MKATLRQSMAWLHTWSGLLAGWLLFAIFLTGTVSYFRPEISQWMRPELRRAEPGGETVELAFQRLQSVAPGARRWLIEPPTSRDPAIHIAYWRDPGSLPGFGRELLDPATGLPARGRATYGGDSLYYFHFDLLLPSVWGRLLVGFASMAMLMAIISGVITHRRILSDFFTFRPRRGQRSWLDAHNACGVLALPYHLMITYSGIVTLMFLYMPWGLNSAYRDGAAAFYDEAGLTIRAPRSGGMAAPLTSVGAVIEAAQSAWQGGLPGRIDVYRPGDAEAVIVLWRSDEDVMAFRGQRLLFDGVTGRLLPDDAVAGPAVDTRNVLYGLHIGRFADPALRWLFFLSGVAGTATIATGLILWAVKRSAAAGKRGTGHRIVDALNIGVIAGLPIAVAALFWANRLLPSGLPDRPDWEIRAFAGLWAAAALHALCRPPARAWIEQLATAATLLTLLPVLNAVTTNRHLGVSLTAGDWAMAGFDLTVLAAGVALGATALAARKPIDNARPRSDRRRRAADAGLERVE